MSLFKSSTYSHDEVLPAPVFELGGKAANLNLSILISTAVLALGISRVGPSVIAADHNAGGFGVLYLGAAFFAFVIVALFCQQTSPDELRTTGIFKLTRNPEAVAFFMPLAALSYFSWMTAISSIIVYVTAMNLTVIRSEERDLQAKFGPHYAGYRYFIPRWIA
jgi:protein-S-isoprenylcysteine O-methyltransferase Ste14